MLMMNTPGGGPYQIASWPAEDLKAHIAFMMGFGKKLSAAGELVGAEGLSGPDQAKLIRAGANGEPITDGVFPESKEFLAGYWIVDVDTPERAYAIAAEASAAPGPGGDRLYRIDLSTEAIRVGRLLYQLLPDDQEVGRLLALMLLTDARRTARTGPNGELIPLDEQVRSLWDQRVIAEGRQILQRALARGATGPFQIQAAVAALHDEASSTHDTDWGQILALYELLLRFEDSPMARLSQAVALAMVHGPAAGLQALDGLAADPHFATSHRLDAVRAHLLERAGNRDEAIRHYRRAAQRTASMPERHYLLLHAARLNESGSSVYS